MADMDVMVIGGGAAGLMAACELAEGDARVLLIEQSDRVGRKLLATGNGRCNLLNMYMERERYFSRDMDAAMRILERHSPEALLGCFACMGLLTRQEDGGRVYPMSGQAASVLDALRLTAQERGVTTECGFAVTRVEQTRFGWQAFDAAGRKLSGRRVVLACGGRAQPTPAADKSAKGLDALELLRAIGHRVHKPQPVLSALRCDMAALKGLKGVRAHGALVLRGRDGGMLGREAGEMLFTEYGVSGIAAMQLSRALVDGAALEIDLMPDWEEKHLRGMLAARAQSMPGRAAESFFAGMLGRMLAQCVLRYADVPPATECGALNRGQIDALAAALKRMRVDVLGAQDFGSAQVMRGGAALEGFDDHLQSRIAPGLYACGELLDVDGECGGYNLMWAWASALAVAEGILSDMAAGKRPGRTGARR